MSRKRNTHYPQLREFLTELSDSYSIEFQQYNEYHMRLMDGFTVLDVWTTGKYYVLESNYYKMCPDVKIIERGGEKGQINGDNKKAVQKFIDKMFFPEDLI